MKAILTTSEYNEFCEKVNMLEKKNYDLPFTVDRQQDGNFKIQIHGKHNIEELDRLTDV
tara:strand:+ start:3235 stop:3411 length:177 start_codon:yes stop_codon:yes gene_type:complete